MLVCFRGRWKVRTFVPKCFCEQLTGTNLISFCTTDLSHKSLSLKKAIALLQSVESMMEQNANGGEQVQQNPTGRLCMEPFYQSHNETFQFNAFVCCCNKMHNFHYITIQCHVYSCFDIMYALGAKCSVGLVASNSFGVSEIWFSFFYCSELSQQCVSVENITQFLSLEFLLIGSLTFRTTGNQWCGSWVVSWPHETCTDPEQTKTAKNWERCPCRHDHGQQHLHLPFPLPLLLRQRNLQWHLPRRRQHQQRHQQ